MTEVITDTITELVFNLLPLPVGSIHGQITDADTGTPISATLEVQNIPISTQSNPSTGAYNLDLPEGTWQINIKSPHYRISHITPTVIATQNYFFDISMVTAPTILVVDSGYWYYNSQAHYYAMALSQLDYLYEEWPIRNPFGLNGLPSDLPGEQDHVDCEVYLDGDWRVFDPARDTAMEDGLRKLEIPLDRVPVAGANDVISTRLASIDGWARERQAARRFREGREALFLRMNEQLDKIRQVGRQP